MPKRSVSSPRARNYFLKAHVRIFRGFDGLTGSQDRLGGTKRAQRQDVCHSPGCPNGSAIPPGLPLVRQTAQGEVACTIYKFKEVFGEQS